jgi:hypothetical protein
MSTFEMFRELEEDQIAPVVALEKLDGNTEVLIFSSSELCLRFAKRNLPKKWVNGEMQVRDDDISFIEKQGWGVERLSWPRRVREEEDITVVVMELSQETEVRGKRV